MSFRQCDGSAFQTDRADGERLAIEDCQFIGAGAFGVLVDGSGGEPITFRNCVLSGQMSDLALRGSRPSVVLVDCQFGRGRIGFYHRSGRAAIQWTAKVKVVEKGSGRPVAGAQVVATGSGEEPEAAEATTGPDGACSLVLTEYVATAELPMRADGRNTQTPHRIVARRDGRVLAEQSYDARGPAGQVTLDVPPPS